MVFKQKKRMKKNHRNKKIGWGIVAALLLIIVIVGGGSNYMLKYSLGYPQQDRKTAEAQRERIRKECPWTVAWMDSVYQNMPSGIPLW